MSKVAIKGNASGTGTFTLEAPNSNTDRTLVLPDEAGTVLTSGGAIDVDASAPADSVAIDSSGNVGIGTSSPSGELHIKSSSGTTSQLIVDNSNSSDESRVLFYNNGSAQWRVGVDSTPNMVFTRPGVLEAMRIDSSGNLLVGTTNQDIGEASSGEGIRLGFTGGEGCGQFVRSGTEALTIGRNSSTGTIVRFRYAGSTMGTISTNGSTTSYNTSSDYRLKENIVDMTDAIDRVKALPVRRFNFIADSDTTVDGFLAHEAQAVVPEAVSGEKDEVEAIGDVTDAEGVVVQEGVTEPSELPEDQTWTKTGDRPVYQGIDQAKLVPLLTGALKEAIARIETLEAKVAALEATP